MKGKRKMESRQNENMDIEQEHKSTSDESA